jgi:hypothetical protein
MQILNLVMTLFTIALFLVILTLYIATVDVREIGAILGLSLIVNIVMILISFETFFKYNDEKYDFEYNRAKTIALEKVDKIEKEGSIKVKKSSIVRSIKESIYNIKNETRNEK